MWYDLVVLGILLFFTIRGAVRGVIWQLAGIAGIILCFFFSQSISAAVGPRINLQPPLNHWVVFFGSYLFFSFIAFGVARLLNDWVEKAQLKEFNRHLGAVFGLLKGVVLCLVMTFMLVTVSESAREALKDSRSGRYAAIIMDRLHPLMPEKLHDALAKYIHRLDTPDLDLQHGDHEHGEVLPGGFDPLAPSLGLPSATGTGVASNLGQPANAPFNPWTGQPQQPAQPQQSQPAASDLWSQLRNSLGADVQNLVINSLTTTDPTLQGQIQNQLAEVLRRTPPEKLPALRQQLLQQGSAGVDQVLAQWLGSGQQNSASSSTIPATPVSQPIPPNTVAPAVDTRTKMLQDISAALSAIPAVRTGLEQQLNAWLASVPEPAATGVLKDLLIDLRGGGQDPDPGTNAGSMLEQRILRQLQINKVPLNAVSPQLQERLRSAQAAIGAPL